MTTFKELALKADIPVEGWREPVRVWTIEEIHKHIPKDLLPSWLDFFYGTEENRKTEETIGEI